MKKIIYKYLIVASLMFTATSCDLDINTNPNFPETADPAMLISSGMAWSVSNFGVEVQLCTSMWSQHYAQNNASNQYTGYDSYNITNTTFNRLWLHQYAGALADLYGARTQSEASAEWQYWITSQVLIAFDYHILNDLFETIPFTQAVNDDFEAPKYDDSKTVNAGIITLLDAAIAKQTDAQSKTSLGSKDLVYGGDIDNWIRFAKTLKLKILMRDFETNKTAIQAMLASGGFLTVDAKVNGFEDKENKSNPLFEYDRRKLNTKNNIKASATMITFLNAYNDPRIADYYEMGSGNDYRGLPQGGYTIEQKVLPQASISRARLDATDPVYFMSVAESSFLQAEAYARLGDKTKAKSFYDDGVRKAFLRWGYDSTISDPFLTGAYEFNDSSTEKMIESIIMQKWVASVRCQAWDAFFDINRTGYPKLGTNYVTVQGIWTVPNSSYVIGELTPSVNSVIGAGNFPKRFLIPKNSSDNNPNAPAVIPITTKMWWHK